MRGNLTDTDASTVYGSRQALSTETWEMITQKKEVLRLCWQRPMATSRDDKQPVPTRPRAHGPSNLGILGRGCGIGQVRGTRDASSGLLFATTVLPEVFSLDSCRERVRQLMRHAEGAIEMQRDGCGRPSMVARWREPVAREVFAGVVGRREVTAGVGMKTASRRDGRVAGSDDGRGPEMRH